MRAALGFLTIVGRSAIPDGRATRWFPLVGGLLGAVVGVIWWGAAHAWSPGVAAALALGADAALTGLLHYDGLVDTADGLLPPMERARRLDVMRTPEAGAFGVVATVVIVAIRWSAWASVRPDWRDVVAVAALWAVSRTLMVVTMRVVPYARADGGLASAFGGPTPRASGRVLAGPAAALLVACSAVTVAGASRALLAGPVTIAAACIAAGALAALARRRLGGYTGDVLGAIGVLAETCGLLVWVARW